jgi:hypothetical protein
LQLALNIGGMLIAFLALIAMVNGMLGWAHGLPGWTGCRFAAENLRRAVRPDRMVDGRELEGLDSDRQSARDAPGAE